jgi:hypothetical protein
VRAILELEDDLKRAGDDLTAAIGRVVKSAIGEAKLVVEIDPNDIDDLADEAEEAIAAAFAAPTTIGKSARRCALLNEGASARRRHADPISLRATRRARAAGIRCRRYSAQPALEASGHPARGTRMMLVVSASPSDRRRFEDGKYLLVAGGRLAW